MAGPRYASSCDGSQPIAATVLSSTPGAQAAPACVGSRDRRPGPITQQDRQAVGDHDDAHVAGAARDARIGLRKRRCLLGLHHARAMHLLQPARLGREVRAQALAIAADCRGIVVDMLREVHGIEGRAADAAVARGDQAVHASRRRPVRHDPVSRQRHAVAAPIAVRRSRLAARHSQVMRAALSGCVSASRAACSAWRWNVQCRRRNGACASASEVGGIAQQRMADGVQVHADLVRAAGLQAALEQATSPRRRAALGSASALVCPSRPRPCACAAPDDGRLGPRLCLPRMGHPAPPRGSHAVRCAPGAGAPGWFAPPASSLPPAARWCPCPAGARCRRAAGSRARERGAATR